MVIKILNDSFVNVMVSNEQYNLNTGSMPLPERQARQKLWNDAARQGLKGGTVAVFALDPQGVPFLGWHVGDTFNIEAFIGQFLRPATARLSVTPGPPAFAPRPLSRPDTLPPAGSLTLHLAARNDNPADFPAESWIVFEPAEIRRLLGSGQSWTVPPELAQRIFMQVYPQSNSSDRSHNNRVEAGQLTAKIVANEKGFLRARLDGQMRLLRSYYPLPNPGAVMVEATLSGYIDFAADRSAIYDMKLATSKASTAQGKLFEVAMTSVPRAQLKQLTGQ